MLRLPSLPGTAPPVGLPLAAGAAVRLSVALLGPSADRAEALAQIIARQPMLVLWIECTAARTDSSTLRGSRGMAQWLLRRGLGHLALPSDLQQVTPLDHQRQQQAISLATRDLQRAQAASAAHPPGSDAADLAALVALISGWRDWLCWSGDEAAIEQVADCLPAWLAAELRQSEIRSEPATAEVSDAALPFRGSAGLLVASDWEASSPQATLLLASAASTVARLSALEHQFDSQLEREKLEAMAELAAGAGHEINNPLAVISGRAQLLLEKETNPRLRNDFLTINRQALRVHEMIANLMLFARPPVPEMRELRIQGWAESLLPELRVAAEERQVVLAAEVSTDLPPVWGDATQLSVALRAICDNALAVLPPGGCLRLEFGTRRGDAGEDRLVIDIHDNGPGISPEVRRHLFDPFYSGRSAGRGLGMGLSKAWRIVALHGGRIDVTSQPGEETTFSILLPVASASSGPQLAAHTAN